jgi:preprotein translocase subunit Sec63
LEKTTLKITSKKIRRDYMNSGNQPKPKSTKEFIAGIVLSIAILPTMFFFMFYPLLVWVILLIVFIANKQYSVAKGMAVGIAIAIFIFLIVCGGLILGIN